MAINTQKNTLSGMFNIQSVKLILSLMEIFTV